MNFIFISPNFPYTYWNFCDRLHRNGVNVLGIGDEPYEQLDPRLKKSLTEYYKVATLEDYNHVFRATAFFSYKYGKIDWIESMNEYWLQQDARLRTDFNVTTGVQNGQIDFIKEKSLMKVVYNLAGIPTARQHKVATLEEGRRFVSEVGYPVIVKPDIGVGANNTWKLKNDSELVEFYHNREMGVHSEPYVMEQFIEGNIVSYDAILDSNCDPLFESSTKWPPSIVDIVVEDKNLAYYVLPDVPEPLRVLGRRTVKAFGVRNRFVHLEFFRLARPCPGVGNYGDYAALEVNMRPAGGYTPDMMNFAHATDVYQIWADMVTTNKRILQPHGTDGFCVYAGRKDGHPYVHTHEEIMAKYGSCMKMQEEMPELNWPQMGRFMYTVRLESQEQTDEFIRFVQDERTSR